MAIPQTKTPSPIPRPPGLDRGALDRRGVVPQAQKAAKPPLGSAATQTPPPPKGVGAERLGELTQANVRVTEPIKALEEMPDVRTALMAVRLALSAAMAVQLRATTDFETESARAMKTTAEMAAKFAEREETLDPAPALMPGDRARSVADRQQRIMNETIDDWTKRYEKSIDGRAGKAGAQVVAKLAAAEQVIDRAELRAQLDFVTPDAVLVAQVLRAVESEPTLQRATKSRFLLETAIKLNDEPLLLALECLLPQLQEIVEVPTNKLTQGRHWQQGEPSKARADAGFCVTTLRALRAQRLSQTSVGRAREILQALQWLAAKSVGIDGSDPYCVGNLNALAPGRMAALASSQIQVFAGKTGARWATRYTNRSAPLPVLRWPALLAPQPMKNMEQAPAVARSVTDFGAVPIARFDHKSSPSRG